MIAMNLNRIFTGSKKLSRISHSKVLVSILEEYNLDKLSQIQSLLPMHWEYVYRTDVSKFKNET